MPILSAAFGFSRGRRSASGFSAGGSNEVCAVPSLVGLEFCALPILFAAFGFFTCLVCHRLISTFRQGLSGCMVFRLYLLSSFHQVRACRSSALALVSQLGAMSISALSQS